MQFDLTYATGVVPSLLHNSPFVCIKAGHRSTRTPTRTDQALLPLSSAKASLSRSEAGEKEKGEARGGRWEGEREQASSHRPPRACYFDWEPLRAKERALLPFFLILSANTH